jgi:hypothetical protein
MTAKALEIEDVDDELTAALEDDKAEDDDDTTAIDTIPVPRKAPSLALIRSLAAAASRRSTRSSTGVQPRASTSEPPPEHDTSLLPPPPPEPSEPFHLKPTRPPIVSEPPEPPTLPGPRSVAPVAWTERPPPLTEDQRTKLMLAGGGGVLAALGAFWLFVVLSGGVALGSSRSSTLVVTASESAASSGIEVFVDGARQCSEFPCRLDDLSRGAHLVHVATPAVAPVRGGVKAPPPERPLPAVAAIPHVDASALPARPIAQRAPVDPKRALESAAAAALAGGGASAPLSAAATERASAKSERPADEPPDEDTESESAMPRGIAAVLAKSFPPPQTNAPSSAAPAPDGKGVLNLSASPRANVAVDGRPLGATPKSIRVAPGSHTVVFASGSRRKVQRVVVKPGATANVGAKL